MITKRCDLPLPYSGYGKRRRRKDEEENDCNEWVRIQDCTISRYRAEHAFLLLTEWNTNWPIPIQSLIAKEPPSTGVGAQEMKIGMETGWNWPPSCWWPLEPASMWLGPVRVVVRTNPSFTSQSHSRFHQHLLILSDWSAVSSCDYSIRFVVIWILWNRYLFGLTHRGCWGTTISSLVACLPYLV